MVMVLIISSHMRPTNLVCHIFECAMGKKNKFELKCKIMEDYSFKFQATNLVSIVESHILVA